MKKIVSFILTAFFCATILGGISAAVVVKDGPAKHARTVLVRKGLKIFAEKPVYCKITKAELKKAKLEAKLNRLAKK